jgi:hypothetical protein
MIVTAVVNGDLAGHINVTGALGTLTVSGSLSGSVTADTLDSLTVGRDLTGQVTVLQGIGNLVIGGSLLGDVSSPAITSALINGTAGDDTFVITPNSVSLNGVTVLSGTYAALTVNGLAGNDRFILAGSNLPATLNGGDGNDTFQFNDGASITGAIDGGAGFNTLDYRAYTTQANVDLGTGAATGVSGGVQNIQNVLGATVSITVTNTADSGPGSLRQAILAANAHPGHDNITFAIPGGGVHTISPTSPLPDITDPVTIDGYSQPGASVNTLAVGDNAVLLIQLDGSSLAAGFYGLHVTVGNSTVQGLMIDNFARTPAPSYLGGYAILLDTGGGNVIQGNILGTHGPGGYLIFSNANADVAVDRGSSNNLIGGTTPAARNVLSGGGSGAYVSQSAGGGNVIAGNYVGTNPAGTAAIANFDGIVADFTTTIVDNVASGNSRFGIDHFGLRPGLVIQGNLIGTDASGTALLSNGSAGIFAPTGDLIGGTSPAARNVITGTSGIGIWGCISSTIEGNYIGTDITGNVPLDFPGDGIQSAGSNNVIGGTAPGAGNVIANCFLANVYLVSGATGNVVEGNFIGTNPAGTRALGYNGVGVLLSDGSSNNTIGGTAPGAGNVIAFNGGAGVAVVEAASTGNSIRGNAIHDNGGLGIDLGNDGVTPNGPPPRTGPNNLQNFPTLQVAGLVAGGTGVVGGLDALPATVYTIDFYANAAADPSGHGQGQTYLGATTVTTDPSGHAAFALLLPAVAPGSVITATATDPAGNTSEFAADAGLQPLADLDISAAGVLHYTASPGVANNLTLSAAGGTDTFTDTGERIFITGAGAAGCAGTGTNTATCPTASVRSIFVNTVDGNNTVHVASAFAGVPVTLDGGTGTNTLVGPDTVNTWQLTGANQGSLNGNVTFRNFANLAGGALGDTFAVTTGGRLDGTLDGGGGVNTLDYSAYAGDVVVDLPLGTATGVAGGIRHIGNVTGSIGNDLLVGDANPNLLIGGTGRNLLIGGAGADTLTGGGGDNLLLGGTTAYDTNLTALLAIMSEWTRSGYSFHQRVDHLMNGTGLNGSYVLNADPSLGPVTVFDGGSADVLSGGGGATWFLYHKVTATLKNRKPGDFLTQI